MIEGLADLELADSTAFVDVHCVKCLLQVVLLEQALTVERCLAELVELDLAALISVDRLEDLLELFLFKVVQTSHFPHLRCQLLKIERAIFISVSLVEYTAKLLHVLTLDQDV